MSKMSLLARSVSSISLRDPRVLLLELLVHVEQLAVHLLHELQRV
jgi:hypothetical protein